MRNLTTYMYMLCMIESSFCFLINDPQVVNKVHELVEEQKKNLMGMIHLMQ